MGYSTSPDAYRDIDGVLWSAAQVSPATLVFGDINTAIRWVGRANFYRRHFNKYPQLILSRVDNTVKIDKHLPPKLLTSDGKEVEIIMPPDFSTLGN